MAGKSLNLDTDVISWLERTAEGERKSESALVNEILRTCMEDPDAGWSRPALPRRAPRRRP